MNKWIAYVYWIPGSIFIALLVWIVAILATLWTWQDFCFTHTYHKVSTTLSLQPYCVKYTSDGKIKVPVEDINDVSNN